MGEYALMYFRLRYLNSAREDETGYFAGHINGRHTADC